MKDKEYRIVQDTFYEKGIPDDRHSYYTVEVKKSFLWIIKYWSSIKEPSYDTQVAIRFSSIEDAKELIKKIKENKKINGWRSTVVWGEPKFEKID
jgi:hypothetical protein